MHPIDDLMPLLGPAGVFVALSTLLVVPTIWRLCRPTPQDDLVAITHFLSNRGQRALAVRKLWFAPWRMRGGTLAEAGRPYRLLAIDADGKRYVHVVAADERDPMGHVKLKQRQAGVWMLVLQ
jgi:hypothetical protein